MFNEENMRQKVYFITIGIGEKYGGAEVSTTKKNNRILG